MKKAHLNKWRKERLQNKNWNPQGYAETDELAESFSRNYANGYHYVLNLIPISPAHGGGKNIYLNSKNKNNKLSNIKDSKFIYTV